MSAIMSRITLNSLYRSAAKVPRGATSLSDAVSAGDVSEVRRKISRGALPDAALLESVVTGSNYNPAIAELVIDTAIEHNVEPTQQMLTNVLALNDLNIQLKTVKLFSVTSTQPNPVHLHDALTATKNAELVEKLGALYTTQNQPEPRALSTVVGHVECVANIELVKAVVDIFAATQTLPPDDALENAVLFLPNTELVEKIGALYSAENKPSPRTLTQVLRSAENLQSIGIAIDVFAATNTPPGEHALGCAIARGNYELVDKLGKLYGIGYKPDPYALMHSFSPSIYKATAQEQTIMRREMVKSVAAIYRDTKSLPFGVSRISVLSATDHHINATVASLFSEIPLSDGQVENIIYHIITKHPEMEDLLSAATNNPLQAAEAYVAWKSTSPDHPLHLPLQEIMQTEQTQAAFMCAVRDCNKRYVSDVASPLLGVLGNSPKTSVIVSMIIGKDFLVPKDAKKLPLAGREFADAARKATANYTKRVADSRGAEAGSASTGDNVPSR